MKKRFVLIAALLFASTASSSAQPYREVAVLNVEGIVDIQKAGKGTWFPAVRGMRLFPGDSIKTTLDSAADLILADGSVIRLQEETQIRVDDLSLKKEDARFLYFLKKPVVAKKVKLSLSEGNIMASVRENPNSKSQFTVETPRGVAGVRGTNWFVGIDKLGVSKGSIKWMPKPPLGVKGQTAGKGIN